MVSSGLMTGSVIIQNNTESNVFDSRIHFGYDCDLVYILQHSVFYWKKLLMQNATQLDRRKISGRRVICMCSVEMPKLDPFSNYNNLQRGPMVFNVRGGSFYTWTQYTDKSVSDIFQDGKPALLRNMNLFPDNRPMISLGDIKARFLRFNGDTTSQGLVLRFVHLSEGQLDKLNDLTGMLPTVPEDESMLVKAMLQECKEP